MNKKKQTLLWVITRQDLCSPCYVFGTMHVRDDLAFEGIDFVKTRIDACDAFAAEFDFNDADQVRLNRSMLLEDGQRLSALLSPKIYKRLKKVLQREMSMPIEQFDRMKPIMLMNLLAEAQLSEDRAESLDANLFAYAKRIGKLMLGVESFEAQLDILEKMPLDGQLKSLKSMATNFSAYRKQITKTADLYATADLVKILKKVKKTTGGMRRLMLYDRNIIMADRIIELGQEQSVFAAIGAGHLGGKKGVLKLLKDRGCEVFPIKYK
ncbi:MAG: TraB/GumN family protein [Saprospiraceae bacterium]|nr:TraB/GumN family protein [Saprospiraceae bacterium]